MSLKFGSRGFRVDFQMRKRCHMASGDMPENGDMPIFFLWFLPSSAYPDLISLAIPPWSVPSIPLVTNSSKKNLQSAPSTVTAAPPLSCVNQSSLQIRCPPARFNPSLSTTSTYNPFNLCCRVNRLGISNPLALKSSHHISALGRTLSLSCINSATSSSITVSSLWSPAALSSSPLYLARQERKRLHLGRRHSLRVGSRHPTSSSILKFSYAPQYSHLISVGVSFGCRVVPSLFFHYSGGTYC
jgi:hypothetical protein